jgi:hypothetical protein
MDKQKYLKFLKQQIKDQEKWKTEAIELLRNEGIDSPECNKNILKYSEKISLLQDQIDHFDESSLEYQAFIQKNTKINTTTKGKGSEEKHLNKFDRWADVKLDNSIFREVSWLSRMDSYLPQYMKDNLAKMPANKGYMWKKIRYFGKLPREEPFVCVILFEKQGSSLYIHEYNSTFYRIYEKSDKQRPKILVFEK